MEKFGKGIALALYIFWNEFIPGQRKLANLINTFVKQSPDIRKAPLI